MRPLFAFFALFHVVYCLKHIEVKGFISGVNSNDVTLKDVQLIVEKAVAARVSDVVVDVISIEENIDVVFVAEISSDYSREQLAPLLKGSNPVVFIFWKELAQPSKRITRAAGLQTDSPCANDGILLPDNRTCRCQPYTSGNSCEIVDCQNWGSKPYANPNIRCKCAPGYESKYCETRGCRPALQDNQNPKQRSFIVVIPAVGSNQTKNDIANAAVETVNSLQQNEPGYFDSFIWCMYVGSTNGGGTTGIMYTDNVQEFARQLKSSFLSTDHETVDQPAMYGIEQALFQVGILRPNSIVLTFTDRMESEAVPETFTPSQKSQQMKTVQRALAWQIKLFFFLIQDGPVPMDVTTPKYDIFRKMATYTHGEVFVINKSEVSDAMKQVVPFFYKPQNTAVRSFTDCSALKINMPPERADETIKVVVTVDRNADTPDNFTIVATNASNSAIITPQISGKYYMLTSIPSNLNIPTLQISVYPPAICSVKLFVSTTYSTLLSYVDHDNVDMGNALNFAEGKSSIAASFMDFTPTGDVILQVVDAYTGAGFLPANYFFAQKKKTDMCSTNYWFADQPQCTEGPYTHLLSITMGAKTITRVLPGLCAHHANVTLSAPIYPTNPPAQPLGSSSCDAMNIDGWDDPRLHQYKHIVFAIEITDAMNSTIKNFLGILNDVVNGIVARDNSEKQYTLVTFDRAGWTARLSETSVSMFITKTQNLLPTLKDSIVGDNGNYYGVYSQRAVYGAINLKLKSQQIIHVFSATNPTYADAHLTYFMPTDVQVNYYTIREDSSAFLQWPMDIQRFSTISGGRLIPLTATSVNSMVDLLIDSTFENNFVFDGSVEDCSKYTQFSFKIEKAATSVSVVIVGLNVSANFYVTDGVNILETRAGDIRLFAPNSIALKYNVIAKGARPGKWSVSAQSSSGPCFVQVRTESTINTAIGFTVSKTDDMVGTWPFTRRSYPNDFPTNVAVRVSSDPVILDSVKMEAFPIEYPWNNTIYKNYTSTAAFHLRDANTCAYQFISDDIIVPPMWALRVTVTGMENPMNAGGYPFERRYFYLNNVDDYCPNRAPTGKCSCDEGYTGEFCTVPICQNGGTSNSGACACLDGFTGTFCETCYYSDCEKNYTPTDPPQIETTTKRKSSNIVSFSVSLLLVAVLVN